MKPGIVTSALALLLLGTAGSDAVGRSGLSTNRLNELVDEILYEASVQLVSEGLDEVPLPEIHQVLKKKIIGSLEIDFQFHLENGMFRNTSTLVRVGNVTERDGPKGEMVFDATLSMEDVHVTQETFDLQFLWSSWSGRVDADLSGNALHLVISLTEAASAPSDGGCKVTVEKAELTSLGGITIRFKPPNMLNRLKADLVAWGLNHSSDIIRAAVNPALKATFAKVIDKFDICALITH